MAGAMEPICEDLGAGAAVGERGYCGAPCRGALRRAESGCGGAGGGVACLCVCVCMIDASPAESAARGDAHLKVEVASPRGG